ncbi:hypothetical protein Tco_0590297 [Tanacetum coccineum]
MRLSIVTTASSLEAEHDSGNINRTQSMATLNEPHPQGEGFSSGPWRQETMGGAPAQTRCLTWRKQRMLKLWRSSDLSQEIRQIKEIFTYDQDELWMDQLDWKLLKWELHENCGVHTLFMDGKPMKINMLVEQKYPLTKELLEQMLNLKLEAEDESTMAFELIKFIKSMLEE